MKGNRIPTRTQSCLYQHEFTSTPIHENRFENYSIVGPEFVVRSQDNPKEIQLKASNNEKMKNLRSVLVILLSGHRIVLKCNPLVTTFGQIFEAIVSEKNIKFREYLSLAFMCKGEFHFPEPKTKIYKVAPSGWNNNRNVVMVQSFTIYLRFLCYPRIENTHHLADNFTNMLYLQLRHDFIEGRILVSMPTMLSLASLTLQAEFGNINKEQSEGYFLMEHYLPEVAHNGDESKEYALEKELILLHRSLKLSPDMAKAQYISRIHGTLSYGTLIYTFLEEKRKTQLLVVSLQGLKVLQEPASFEKLLEADLIAWSIVKKLQISSPHRLTITSKYKTNMKKHKLFFSDNRYKYVWNVCSQLCRWQQKQFGVESVCYENSMNNATQNNLFKFNSEINLYQNNSISKHPEATPHLQNFKNEKANKFQKVELSASCMNITDKEYFLPRRRLNSVYQTAELCDSLQNTQRTLISYIETTEYPDSSGNSCLVNKSPKLNLVTYFPSEGNCSPVKAEKTLEVQSRLSVMSNINDILTNVKSPAITEVVSANIKKENNNPCATEINGNNLTPKCEQNLEKFTFSIPNSSANESSQIESSKLSANKSLFQNSIQATDEVSVSKIKPPSNVSFKCTNTSSINSLITNNSLMYLKRSATSANESLPFNGMKRNSTIIKVNSLNETSNKPSHRREIFHKKIFVPKNPEIEDIYDSDLPPYSFPKKTSIGVKMGTKVSAAILQKHKLLRPGQAVSSEDIHNAIVIEPDVADIASPIRGPEESVDDSLVRRFLAVPSPECGLAERKLITVSLARIQGSFGITILPAVDGSLYVSELATGGPAFNGGVLRQGDRLMGVNGFSVENLSGERTLSMLKSSLDPVELLVSQPIQQNDLIEIEKPHKNELREKHVTIIQVSSGPSSCEYFAESSLSPSEPISV